MDARVKPAHDEIINLLRDCCQSSRPAKAGEAPHASRPWQCLYFLPEPQGQSSLRPTLPQLEGFFGSRLAALAFGAGASDTLANAISSSPVLGSNLCASMCGSTGCCSSGGTISTRISCAVTASRRCAIIASNRLNASDLSSCSGSPCP